MPPPRGSFNPIEGPADYDMTTIVHNDTYPAIDPLQFDLKGRAVFVNGASRGMGRSMAVAFAQAGASHIAIGSRSEATQTIEAMKKAAEAANKPMPDILPIEIDVASEESVKKAGELVRSQFGRLDIVINNAGAFAGFNTRLLDLTFDDWKKNFDVNLHGPFLVMREFAPLLLATENGLKTFVIVSSVGAHCKTPGLSGYQTSKLAVLRLSEFAAAEYADQGLLTYSIHPGNMPSEIIDIPDELRHIFTDTPELCANTLVYLTSEKRDWLSGRYVNVTWDMPELMAKEEELVREDKLKVRLAV